LPDELYPGLRDNVVMNTHCTMLRFVTIIMAVGFSMVTDCLAWGPDGHRTIGLLALQNVTPEVRDTLLRLGGSESLEELADACNWPDRYRATKEGAWSAPQHYVNIPRGASGFQSDRDCPDGQCVTGAIERYETELSDATLDDLTRWQAFARVCHFVGDLHQPLHAGYRDDRGGNDFAIRFDGEDSNLHQFWDRLMITYNYPNWLQLTGDLGFRPSQVWDLDWQPGEIDDWADESYRLVRTRLYPHQAEIDRAFAAESWLLALERLSQAAHRLARVLEASMSQQ
jgi:hypothetical protein